MHVRGRAVPAALIALALACAGCDSGKTVTGSPFTGALPSATAHTPDFPAAHSPTPATAPPSVPHTAGAPASPAPTGPTTASAGPRPLRTIAVTGTSSGRTYEIAVWGQDTIHDCAAHAYGRPLQEFLQEHNCRSATRRVLTTSLDGRDVALSTIAVVCPTNGTDPQHVYDYARELTRLERADGTGSINDLLREGGSIAGVHSGIPRNEAFLVAGQDVVVMIFDAWYLHGATADQDAHLIDLERDLELTAASAPAS